MKDTGFEMCQPISYTYCMPRSRFLQSTVISIASDEYPVGRGQNTEAKIGQPCGPRITRNYAAMVSWLLTGSPPWLALISGWRLSGATSQGQPGTPAWMLPSMRDGLSAQLMEVWCPFRGSSMGRHVHRALMRNALRDWLTIVPTKACWQRNYVGAYSRFMHVSGMSRISRCSRRTAGHTRGRATPSTRN